MKKQLIFLLISAALSIYFCCNIKQYFDVESNEICMTVAPGILSMLFAFISLILAVEILYHIKHWFFVKISDSYARAMERYSKMENEAT